MKLSATITSIGSASTDIFHRLIEKLGEKSKKIIGKVNGIVDDLMTCDGRFIDNRTGYSTIFDDDGRVAYAYLLDETDSIVGDVWLYNRCSTPVEPEWKEPENMPFANPQAYVNGITHDVFQVVDTISDVNVVWGNESGRVKVNILIHDELFATLIEGG
ncbi:hypothetical protein KDD30_15295 [Photobacterium sp. GJ3]|uniref:hypothetical protein n=1 Tax=Photobacterium sp. GJ3 TaxID=2829502 RepID=UPI001B8C5745|nr:hypothetical protein [Photobacterium sp. GJ3]QUJ67380.1 hypothetical protein KDD30_15295 [Photobacterium sp. GJ3]